MDPIMASAGMESAELKFVAPSIGVKFAYRRPGRVGNGVPVVFPQHFRGNIDNWDPLLVDSIAAQRDVILFDNTGVGASSGETPRTVERMAQDALAFLDAVGVDQADLFGFSLGGFVAQELSLGAPDRAPRSAVVVMPNTSSPTATPGTPSPTSSTTPAASNPVRYGNVVGARPRTRPDRTSVSPADSPDARAAMRIRPGPACGSGTSATCTTSGGPYSLNCTALMRWTITRHRLRTAAVRASPAQVRRPGAGAPRGPAR
jgi:pimeloyl-ACP methyl ester carboxylesterase